MKKILILSLNFVVFSLSSQIQEITKINSQGISVKVGEIKQLQNGNMDIYMLNKSNLLEKTQTITPTKNGYDIYRINSIGIPVKESSIREVNSSPLLDIFNERRWYSET